MNDRQGEVLPNGATSEFEIQESADFAEETSISENKSFESDSENHKRRLLFGLECEDGELPVGSAADFGELSYFANDFGMDISTPDLIQEKVLASIKEWEIVCLGNRPEDHMVRDCLHGSLLRDYRARRFHSCAKNPPDWIQPLITKIPPRFKSEAIRHLMLRQMHGTHLYRMAMQGMNRTILMELWNCRPLGALLAWSGKARRIHDYTCGHKRLCPWCHAREVVRLHSQLRESAWKVAEGKQLVMLWTAVPSENIKHENCEYWEAVHRYNKFGSPARPWFIEGSAINARHRLTSAEVNIVREQLGRQIVTYAREVCGLTGGLVTHRVGPRLITDGCHSFIHTIAVLGESPLNRQELVNRFDTGQCSSGSYFPPICVTGHEVLLRFICLDGLEPQALRFLLAGSSFSYPVGNLMLNPERARGGVTGAMSTEPHFLFDAVQWESHMSAMRGLPLYRTFGQWRKRLRTSRSGEPKVLLCGPSTATRRTRRIQIVNRARREARDRRLKELFEFTQPMWIRLSTENGDSPGHIRLRKALVESGRRISERDARSLVKYFIAGKG